MGWPNQSRAGLRGRGALLVLAVVAVLPLPAGAQTRGMERRQERRRAATEQYPDLSWRLQNPLARILVLPTSAEYRKGGGPFGEGEVFSIRFAPRVPFVLNEDWHVISKTDLAWVSQDEIAVGEQEGLSDLIQTFFFSPDRSIAWDLYWGAGPSFVLPTASDDFLGTEKFSMGPTFAVFRQREDWTAGLTLSHVWSVAGPDGVPDVSLSRVEPVVAYTAPTSTTIALGAELTYDWENEIWRGPLTFRVSQLTLIRERPIQWLSLIHI